MAERLLSPLGRRIVRKAQVEQHTIDQLLILGWTEYDGPAKTTWSEKERRLRGWVVPGTDANVDTRRHMRTGTLELSVPRVVR